MRETDNPRIKWAAVGTNLHRPRVVLVVERHGPSRWLVERTLGCAISAPGDTGRCIPTIVFRGHGYTPEPGGRDLVGVGQIVGQARAGGCFHRNGRTVVLRGPATPVTAYQEQEVPDAQAVVLSLLGPAETANYDVVPSNAGQPTRCTANDLGLSVALTASVMSQPFSDIAVTNTGTQACVLSGYPRIHAHGHREGTDPDASAVVPQPVDVRRGRSYERIDPGPRRVVIRPLHEVFFSIGTATAFQAGRHLITLTRLTIVLPGTHVPKTLPINLLASRPPGRRIPVTITAIGASPQG